jgi:hypothetical protein
MSNENIPPIFNKDININLFYNLKEYSIPKSYIDNIDLLFEEKNVRNFLNNNLNITNKLNIPVEEEIEADSNNSKV